jgi:hypothetical protein
LPGAECAGLKKTFQIRAPLSTPKEKPAPGKGAGEEQTRGCLGVNLARGARLRLLAFVWESERAVGATVAGGIGLFLAGEKSRVDHLGVAVENAEFFLGGGVVALGE